MANRYLVFYGATLSEAKGIGLTCDENLVSLFREGKDEKIKLTVNKRDVAMLFRSNVHLVIDATEDAKGQIELEAELTQYRELMQVKRPTIVRGGN